jgi:hypothetical protein
MMVFGMSGRPFTADTEDRPHNAYLYRLKF